MYVSPNKILTIPKLAYPKVRNKPEINTGFSRFWILAFKNILSGANSNTKRAPSKIIPPL